MLRAIGLVYLYMCLYDLSSGENLVSSISSILYSINTTANVAMTTTLGPQINDECPGYFVAKKCLDNKNDLFMDVIKSIESVDSPPWMRKSFCGSASELRSCLLNQISGCPTVVHMVFDLLREFYRPLCDSYGYNSFVNSLMCFNNSLFTLQVEICAQSIQTDWLGADICWLPNEYIDCVTQAANISCSEQTTADLTAFLQGVFFPFKVFFCNSSIDHFDAITNSTNGTSISETTTASPTSLLVNSNLPNTSGPEVSTAEPNSTIDFGRANEVNSSVSDTTAAFGAKNGTYDADQSTAEITTTAAPQNTDTSTVTTTTTASSSTTTASSSTTTTSSPTTTTSSPTTTASSSTTTTSSPTTTTSSPTTTASRPTTTLPPRPPFQCYDCSSGAPGYWQNPACPANGSLIDWARQTQSCNGPCVTTVTRWPLGDVIRSCSKNYRYQFPVPSSGCKKSNDDLVCFCSGDRCNDRNMTREQFDLVTQYAGWVRIGAVITGWVMIDAVITGWVRIDAFINRLGQD
ncbi:hypothetical protein Btru_025650 [Bulinus truncatus]|nr:hypothetical protein Btru_025650 [Bulinus truncatus]